MRLTFDYGYDDFSDSGHWPARLQELCTFADGLNIAAVGAMDDDALLDAIEPLEELVRYYAVKSDMKRLETVMRLQMRLLQAAKERGIRHIGLCYAEMQFLRANAILFRTENKNRQAEEYYNQAVQKAEACFAELQQSCPLNNEQKLFVGWACVEVFSEAAQVYDLLMEPIQSMQKIDRTLAVLEWLEPYRQGAVGLIEKSAELYGTYGGVFFQAGRTEDGRKCFETSVTLFRGLDHDYGSDFYYARSIWVKGLHGLQEFLCAGNPRIMLGCELEAEQGLAGRLTHPRDRAIASAAMGLVLAQKGSALQQNGDLTRAVEQMQRGCELLNDAFDTLEKDHQEPHSDYYRAVMTALIVRIFSCYVGLLDVLGVYWYHNKQLEKAKAALGKAVDLLTSKNEYKGSETGATIVYAECYLYLALIVSEEGDVSKAEFYGARSVSFAADMAKCTQNSAALGIEITACALVCEFCLAVKNKPKAAEYAETGLEACSVLAGIDPQNDRLELRALLEKYRKKALRKFF